MTVPFFRLKPRLEGEEYEQAKKKLDDLAYGVHSIRPSAQLSPQHWSAKVVHYPLGALHRRRALFRAGSRVLCAHLTYQDFLDNLAEYDRPEPESFGRPSSWPALLPEHFDEMLAKDEGVIAPPVVIFHPDDSYELYPCRPESGVLLARAMKLGWKHMNIVSFSKRLFTEPA